MEQPQPGTKRGSVSPLQRQTMRVLLKKQAPEPVKLR
jgi:hypothetical protein